MANIKSNEKRRRQDDKRNLRNKSLKSQIKTQMKKAQTTKKQEDVDYAVSLINKAISSNVFHKNKAARLTSKMQMIETTK